MLLWTVELTWCALDVAFGFGDSSQGPAPVGIRHGDCERYCLQRYSQLADERDALRLLRKRRYWYHGACVRA